MNMQVSPPTLTATCRRMKLSPAAHPARRYLIGGVALVAGAGRILLLVACRQRARARGLVGMAPVRVANVLTSATWRWSSTRIGTVVANSTVSVTARVQGQLTKAFFKEGQMVKTGDLLFQIDPAPLSGRL